MDRRARNPTCVLKVNIGCCKACAVNLNKLLKKIEGVDAVDIDPKTGLVTVSGKVDPATLVKKIEKKKKKAEVLSYEVPKSAQSSGGDDGCCCCDEKQNGGDSNHEFGDHEAPKEFDEIECRDPYCRLHRTKPIIPRNNEYGHVIKLHHHSPPLGHLQYHPPPPPPPPPPDHRQYHPSPPPPLDHLPPPPLSHRYPPQSAFYPSWYRAHLPQSGSNGCYYPRPSPPPHYGYYRRS